MLPSDCAIRNSEYIGSLWHETIHTIIGISKEALMSFEKEINLNPSGLKGSRLSESELPFSEKSWQLKTTTITFGGNCPDLISFITKIIESHGGYNTDKAYYWPFPKFGDIFSLLCHIVRKLSDF